MSKSVLIIATSHDKLGDTGKPTGCWAEEFMAPYQMFHNAGYKVSIASMKGGKIPIDEGSMADQYQTDYVKSFCASDTMQKTLEDTIPIAQIHTPELFDAIYVPGGHGCCFDMPESEKLQELLAKAYEAGKIVSSVCHGPTCMVNICLSDGSKLVKGKKVTGFANTEEEAVGAGPAIPFLLEDALKKAGGEYSKGDDWSPYAVQSGNLITGQNPQSSEKVASMVIAALA